MPDIASAHRSERHPEHRHGGHDHSLERTTVVQAALQLLNDVGYSGLTVRRLAERLGVKAAALYWHFENKQDLITAMGQAMLLQAFEATPPTRTAWRDLLTDVATTNRKALVSWRDGAQVMAHADLTGSKLLSGMEFLVKQLLKQGFTAELAMTSIFTVVRFTLGCVFEEQADPRAQLAPAARAERFKKFVAAAGVSVEFSQHHLRTPDQQFDSGLELILSGIASRLDAAVPLA